jgi:hypothetical protein
VAEPQFIFIVTSIWGLASPQSLSMQNKFTVKKQWLGDVTGAK